VDVFHPNYSQKLEQLGIIIQFFFKFFLNAWCYSIIFGALGHLDA